MREILKNKILILDGAMGTEIQSYNLKEADYRLKTFKDHPCDLKGNNDLLSLTQPNIIKEIHKRYLKAGADIITTNTFNATSISQEDYQMESIVYELNKQSALIAKQAIIEMNLEKSSNPRFVCGSLGPTNKTASMSPDVNNPAFRSVDFLELVNAYKEQTRGLIDGGVDLILIETVFDTLNCKAALFAVYDYFEEENISIPVMV